MNCLAVVWNFVEGHQPLIAAAVAAVFAFLQIRINMKLAGIQVSQQRSREMQDKTEKALAQVKIAAFVQDAGNLNADIISRAEHTLVDDTPGAIGRWRWDYYHFLNRIAEGNYSPVNVADIEVAAAKAHPERAVALSVLAKAMNGAIAVVDKYAKAPWPARDEGVVKEQNDADLALNKLFLAVHGLGPL